MKTLWLTLLVLIGVSLALPWNADAAKVEVNTCRGDYYEFVYKVRSENTRTAYFKDFFTLSACQIYDINALYDELDVLRDNFKSAAINCADTSSYKANYHRILMEVEFIRSLQSTPAGILQEMSDEEVLVLQEAILNRVYENMTRSFVTEEQRVNQKTFDSYWEQWTSDYEDKILRYKACDEGPWGQLNDVFDDFVDTMENLEISVDPPEKRSLLDILTPETDSDIDINTGSIGRCILSGFDCFKADKAQRDSELDPSYTPATVPSRNFSTALELIDNSERQRELLEDSNARMAEYRLLYGDSGSADASSLQGVLMDLNEVLQISNAKDFPAIELGVSQVYDLQCN